MIFKNVTDSILFRKKILKKIIYKLFYDPFIKTARHERIQEAVDQLCHDSKSDVLISFRKKGRGEEYDRYTYQNEIIEFAIKKTDKVLDIGSGGDPFPLATHIADFYENETPHRSAKLVKDHRSFINCNIEDMPFAEKEFDFVYCSHVLEHVNDPISACSELIRIGKRGYIETPTKTSDIMLNFTKLKNHHKWYIEAKGDLLIFLEFSEQEQYDLGSDNFFNELHSKWDNPFQRLFTGNRKVFNNMFLWENTFRFLVIDKNGKILNKVKE